jgi:Amiloride-sensitive sodium channel
MMSSKLSFFFAEIPGVKFCGISDIECYQMVVRQNVEENIIENQSSSCDCLPTCTSISYDVDINHVQMPVENKYGLYQ